jgi:hypothetical protein
VSNEHKDGDGCQSSNLLALDYSKDPLQHRWPRVGRFFTLVSLAIVAVGVLCLSWAFLWAWQNERIPRWQSLKIGEGPWRRHRFLRSCIDDALACAIVALCTALLGGAFARTRLTTTALLAATLFLFASAGAGLYLVE